MDESPRYWAFLSDSHADRAVAGRLHRALEGYTVPRRLVGREGPQGPVPARIYPVFRDRDELDARGEIGSVVEAALAASRALVVLCSPASAHSQWVEAEIAAFRRLRPDAPVLCVLLEGQLETEGRGRDAARSCLGPALQARFGALATVALVARDGAKRRQAQAEDLLGFMLGDLRGKLEKVGQQRGAGRRLRDHGGGQHRQLHHSMRSTDQQPLIGMASEATTVRLRSDDPLGPAACRP